MQANPSSAWKNEIQPIVEEHDFGLEDVYDAGPSFRQDDHQCDFCGTHLRYTARVAAENDQNIEYKVGLDCLEHTMGTAWSHMQDVERKIKDLKKEAKKQRRKEKYAEEYSDMIEWLEKRLEIADDDQFLSEMLHILKTGERKFSQSMRDSVVQSIRNTDFEQLRRKQQKVEDWLRRVDGLLQEIIEKDAIEFDDDGEPVIGRPYGEGRCSYEFVADVRDYLERKGKLTEKQMEALNSVASTYSDREVWEEPEEEEEEETEKIPF